MFPKICKKQLSTEQQEHAQLEVDACTFFAALQDGALEECLRYVEHEAATGRPDPLLNCRLAEALLHRGRREDALGCVRRGFPEAAGDAELLRICACVFSKQRLIQLMYFDQFMTMPS